jgi:hypothetical protein
MPTNSAAMILTIFTAGSYRLALKTAAAMQRYRHRHVMLLEALRRSVDLDQRICLAVPSVTGPGSLAMLAAMRRASARVRVRH